MIRNLIIIIASLIFFSSSFAFAWTEQRKTFFLEGGYTYDGEVNFMGIPNGKGKMYFCKPWKNESERNSSDSCPKRFEVLNGDKYEGEFIKGQRHGYGIHYFKQANNNLINNKSIIRIEGQWQNNQVSNGSFYFSDGTNFSGTLSEANDKYTSENIRLRIEQDKIKQQKFEEEQRQSRYKYLEDNFGRKCSKNKANNAEYNKCLNEQEQIAKKEKAIQEAKQAEENKKKQLIADKQKADEDKLNKMLANMKPEERRAYVCEKTYGLRKGSDKFSECVYKILAADVELEKIELQKKLAEAQLATVKANEAAARANASASASRGNVSSYDPNVAAAMDRANEIERAKILLNLSQALRTPSASPQFNAPPRQQNCKLNPYNNRITCY
ncbi:MAG: hypothetical protein NTY55_11855 [Flavobacteriia bacterium]|nr:hypothetical protein [Flavobacteriia bacterium]